MENPGRWMVYADNQWMPADFRFEVGWYGRLAGLLEDPPPLDPHPSHPIEYVPTIRYDYMPGVYAYVASPDGYFNHTPTWMRTYKGDGDVYMVDSDPSMDNIVLVPADGVPVYHGYMGSRLGGKRRGFVWVPRMSLLYRCIKVEVQWNATYMFNKNSGRISFGYHSLPLPAADSISYFDERLLENVFDVSFREGERKWVTLPGFEDYVNAYRFRDFGFFVGHDSYSQDYAGYGEPISIKYSWGREPGWQG